MSEPGEFRPSKEDIEYAKQVFGEDEQIPFQDHIFTVGLDEIGDIEDPQPMEDAQSVELLEELGARAILREHMTQVLANLTAREKMVLDRRYGLLSETQHTLEEIGIELGMEERGKPLTRERIRQIENKALLKLRRHPQQVPLNPLS